LLEPLLPETRSLSLITNEREWAELPLGNQWVAPGILEDVETLILLANRFEDVHKDLGQKRGTHTKEFLVQL
jgi:hypothetical protein